MKREKQYKRVCDICGDVFVAGRSDVYLCFSCREVRRRYHGRRVIKDLSKISLNMGAIQRLNNEAIGAGTDYGKYVGKLYAAERVRVVVPEEYRKGDEKNG